MTGSRSRPAFASQDWMLEQQLRAEMEAEAWRRMRHDLVLAEPLPAAPPQPQAIPAPAPTPARDPHRTGSAILKALVRFMLAAVGAYLAYLAAIDSQLGEFEVWLATGAGFLVTLSLSMFGVARDFVHMLAETARWMIILAVGLGALWVFVQMSA